MGIKAYLAPLLCTFWGIITDSRLMRFLCRLIKAKTHQIVAQEDQTSANQITKTSQAKVDGNRPESCVYSERRIKNASDTQQSNSPVPPPVTPKSSKSLEPQFCRSPVRKESLSYASDQMQRQISQNARSIPRFSQFPAKKKCFARTPESEREPSYEEC